MHPGAEVVQRVDRRGMGMAVVVVAPRADEGDPGLYGVEQGRIGGRAAVVGHLQQPGTQGSRPLQQDRLTLLLDIAGEQGPLVATVHPQHQRHLVGLAVAAEEGTAARGRQDVHVESPDGRMLARHGFEDGRVTRRGRLAQPRLVGLVGGDRAQPHRPDVDGLHHGRQPHGVVGMGMAQDHEVQRPDPAPTYPRGDGVLVGPPVHQDPRATPLDQDRVALADVDGRHGQARRCRTGDRDQQGRTRPGDHE